MTLPEEPFCSSKRSRFRMVGRVRTFLAGFLVLVPRAVTVSVIVWVGSFIYAYVGPEGRIGRIRISIGFGLPASPSLAVFR